MLTPQQQQQYQQQRKMMAAVQPQLQNQQQNPPQSQQNSQQNQQNPQQNQQQNFWILPGDNNGVNHIANYQNRNGFYTSANQMQNADMLQNKYANIPLPPGFSSVQQVANNSAPVSTECIESK